MKAKFILFLFSCNLLVERITARSKYVKPEEDNPYEFGFTIDGNQHRHEKKDVNGIIQGEFGFITADGVYHVTVYATDENGNYKVLSMRNVRISGPLDQPNAQLPDTSQFSKDVPKVVAPNPLSIEGPKVPIQSITQRPNQFTTLPAGKPACAGCQYVKTNITSNKLPFQTEAFRQPNNGNNGNNFAQNTGFNNQNKNGGSLQGPPGFNQFNQGGNQGNVGSNRPYQNGNQNNYQNSNQNSNQNGNRNNYQNGNQNGNAPFTSNGLNKANEPNGNTQTNPQDTAPNFQNTFSHTSNPQSHANRVHSSNPEENYSLTKLPDVTNFKTTQSVKSLNNLKTQTNIGSNYNKNSDTVQNIDRIRTDSYDSYDKGVTESTKVLSNQNQYTFKESTSFPLDISVNKQTHLSSVAPLQKQPVTVSHLQGHSVTPTQRPVIVSTLQENSVYPTHHTVTVSQLQEHSVFPSQHPVAVSQLHENSAFPIQHPVTVSQFQQHSAFPTQRPVTVPQLQAHSVTPIQHPVTATQLQKHPGTVSTVQKHQDADVSILNIQNDPSNVTPLQKHPGTVPQLQKYPVTLQERPATVSHLQEHSITASHSADKSNKNIFGNQNTQTPSYEPKHTLSNKQIVNHDNKNAGDLLINKNPSIKTGGGISEETFAEFNRNLDRKNSAFTPTSFNNANNSPNSGAHNVNNQGVNFNPSINAQNKFNNQNYNPSGIKVDSFNMQKSGVVAGSQNQNSPGIGSGLFTSKPNIFGGSTENLGGNFGGSIQNAFGNKSPSDSLGNTKTAVNPFLNSQEISNRNYFNDNPSFSQNRDISNNNRKTQDNNEGISKSTSSDFIDSNIKTSLGGLNKNPENKESFISSNNNQDISSNIQPSIAGLRKYDLQHSSELSKQGLTNINLYASDKSGLNFNEKNPNNKNDASKTNLNPARKVSFNANLNQKFNEGSNLGIPVQVGFKNAQGETFVDPIQGGLNIGEDSVGGKLNKHQPSSGNSQVGVNVRKGFAGTNSNQGFNHEKPLNNSDVNRAPSQIGEHGGTSDIKFNDDLSKQNTKSGFNTNVNQGLNNQNSHSGFKTNFNQGLGNQNTNSGFNTNGNQGLNNQNIKSGFKTNVNQGLSNLNIQSGFKTNTNAGLSDPNTNSGFNTNVNQGLSNQNTQSGFKTNVNQGLGNLNTQTGLKTNINQGLSNENSNSGFKVNYNQGLSNQNTQIGLKTNINQGLSNQNTNSVFNTNVNDGLSNQNTHSGININSNQGFNHQKPSSDIIFNPVQVGFGAEKDNHNQGLNNQNIKSRLDSHGLNKPIQSISSGNSRNENSNSKNLEGQSRNADHFSNQGLPNQNAFTNANYNPAQIVTNQQADFNPTFKPNVFSSNPHSSEGTNTANPGERRINATNTLINQGFSSGNNLPPTHPAPGGLVNPLSLSDTESYTDAPPTDVTVTRTEIKVPNNPPIPIKDKYPNMVDGPPQGISKDDITGILYKFNYTVGFHGHYEKGFKNGAKVGGYFVTDRDGVSRVVTYVADELGYRPKVKLIRLDLTSDLVPKEGTEKTFGLKNFEFVWYPLN